VSRHLVIRIPIVDAAPEPTETQKMYVAIALRERLQAFLGQIRTDDLFDLDAMEVDFE
jgi:hypothetical protein